MMKNNIIRGVSIKDSHWPEYMMPMFGLLMTESRILRKIAEYELEYGSREEAVIEYIADIKEKIQFGASIYGMNDLLVEKGKTLKDVCENDTGFNSILQQYLEAYDAETKDLLGIIPREGDNKLDLNKYLKILDDKGVKFQYMQAWSKVATADLEDDKPQISDEDALGFSYEMIDDFLEGKEIPSDIEDKIIHQFKITDHKRHLPVSFFKLNLGRK